MQKNETRPAHVQEFIGKYEETNPISKYLVNNFYKAFESLLPDDIASVLEAGCGAGYSADRILPLLDNATYEGSDIGEDLVAIAAEKHPDINFDVESIYDLQREDNSYDLTIALETLEHLDEPLKALQELKRVSRKYVIVSVPREPIWRILNMARFKYLKNLGNTPGHINHWSHRSFKKFLSQEAKIIEAKKPLPWNMVLLDVS